MKSKALAVLLAVVMGLGLCACGSGSGSGSAAPAGEAPAAEASADAGAEASGDVYNVIMQIVTWGNEWPGIQDVEDAINAITVPEIGVSVTLVPVAAWDLPTTSALQITSGEKLDLMCILPMGSGLDNIANYSNKNMILPLNDLVAEYGQDITSVLGENINIGYVGETLYAITPMNAVGANYSFVARQQVLDELGYTFDEETVYGLDTLDELFAAYQAKYGDGYYPIAGFNNGELTTHLVAFDTLGGSSATGVLKNAGLDDTTVVNRFATEEYRAACDKIREWYLKGYINPDVLAITDTWVGLLETGNYLGAFSGVAGPFSLIGNENSMGEELTAIRIIDDYATTSRASTALWTIPTTCENPEKTMQFLNLLYQERDRDVDIDTLITCGLEGVSYEVVEDLGGSEAIVRYPDGLNNATVPYTSALPIYGNGFTVPQYEPFTAEIEQMQKDYNQTIADKGRYSKAFGYTFDSSEYSNEIAAINNVITQYEGMLGWGTVDVESTLAEFNSQLEAAGIDRVIEANQQQLDAWLALQ